MNAQDLYLDYSCEIATYISFQNTSQESLLALYYIRSDVICDPDKFKCNEDSIEFSFILDLGCVTYL